MIETRYLKDNIQNIQKLMTIPSLKNFETRYLGRLLKLSKIREYEDGERIIIEGDRDPWLYFLLVGSVKVSKGGVEITRLNQVGELFGEMRIIDSLERSATVTAMGRTTCIAVNTTAHGPWEGDGVDPDARLDFILILHRIFAEYMSVRLRATTEELIKTKQDLQRIREEKMNVIIRRHSDGSSSKFSL